MLSYCSDVNKTARELWHFSYTLKRSSITSCHQMQDKKPWTATGIVFLWEVWPSFNSTESREEGKSREYFKNSPSLTKWKQNSQSTSNKRKGAWELAAGESRPSVHTARMLLYPEARGQLRDCPIPSLNLKLPSNSFWTMRWTANTYTG